MKYSELKALVGSFIDTKTDLEALSKRLRSASNCHWDDPSIYTLDKSEVLSFAADEIDNILEAVAATTEEGHEERAEEGEK